MPNHIPDIVFRHGLAELRGGVFRDDRIAPLSGRLGKDLDRRGTEGMAPTRSQMDPARGGDVRPEQRGGGSAVHMIREDDNPVRILLAGDVSARQDGLERHLLQAGFEVVEENLLRPISGQVPTVALISAVDEVYGGPVLQRLAAMLPAGIPVVMMLQRGDGITLTRLLDAGAAEVILPPLDVGQIVARVRARVRGSRQISAAVRLSRQASRLFDAFGDVSAALRPEETVQVLVSRLGEVLNLSHAACLFWTPSQSEVRLVAVHREPRRRDQMVDPECYPEATEAVRDGTTILVPDIGRHPLFLSARSGQWADTFSGVRSAAAIPLRRHGRVIGAIVLRTAVGEVLTEDQVNLAERLVNGAGGVIEAQGRVAAISRRHLGSQSPVDSLTGCANLDQLDQRLTEEFERTHRYGLSFSLVLFDVTGLSAFNQRLGTEAGDRLLRDLGTILQRELRGPDFVARYGGDEFALVLPVTQLVGARRMIDRIRTRVAAHPFPDLQPGEHLGLRAGVVTCPHPAAVATEDLFALAETALLQAKAGGDGVGVADPLAA